MEKSFEKVSVGFGRVDIVPENGINISGYFIPRICDGVLDPIELNALAFEKDGVRALVIAIDSCMLYQQDATACRAAISAESGIPKDAIYITATHTHTGPVINGNSSNDRIKSHFEFLKQRMVEVSVKALADLKPSKMGWAVGHAPNLAFKRRFRMKDGSVRTNPGIGNPDIVGPIGEIDDRVSLLRFDQDGGSSLLLVNFGMHPDSIGGCKISADWPGFLRRTVEKALPNVKCLFINGAEGDVGAQNVNAKDGEMNDLTLDFDDVYRGYGQAAHMGYAVAGAVLQVFSKVNYRSVDGIRFLQRPIDLPSNMPAPSDMELAHKYHKLHTSGKDDEIPYKGMMLTTVVAEAARMVRLEHGPESFHMNISSLAIGNVALIGIPGEPFTDIGVGIKDAPEWDLVLVSCNTNGSQGYFPMMDSYQEGGYEARSSNYKAGCGEFLIKEGQALLADLKAK